LNHSRGVACGWAWLSMVCAVGTHAEPMGLISPIAATGNEPGAPWRVALLPRQKAPATRFDVHTLEGQRVLRVVSKAGYGNLLHPLEGDAAVRVRWLQWRWRVDKLPERADLRTREGDDVALKVCAFFDWPLERVPMLDRARLETASLVSGQAVPTATLCYVWDHSLPAQQWQPNAYTKRLRLWSPGREALTTKAWSTQRRDLHEDFKQAFADEWREGDRVPAVTAVLIGADVDNTRGDSLGYVSVIEVTP
jgi:hypothetical protein